MTTAPHHPTRLTLVGFRACGKSTVGRLVAARLAWPFIDLDHLLEEQFGCPISQVFREQGEAAFRAAEQAALAKVLAVDSVMVLATGGGAVLRNENQEQLRARGGLVVYLEVPMAMIQERLGHHGHGRPSLTGGSIVDEAPLLFAQREPLYRHVATVCMRSEGSPSDAAERLADLTSHHFLLNG